MIGRGKQQIFLINIPSIEDRLTMRGMFEKFIFKTAQKMLARVGLNGDSIAIQSMFL